MDCLYSSYLNFIEFAAVELGIWMEKPSISESNLCKQDLYVTCIYIYIYKYGMQPAVGRCSFFSIYICIRFAT